MKNSGFGRLAPELREKIWRHALLVPAPIFFCHDGATWHVGNQRFRLYSLPAALRVQIPLHRLLASMTACRQMYREMFGIFFAVNHFCVSKNTIMLGRSCAAKLGELRHFLGRAASAALPHLQIDGGSYDISIPVAFSKKNSALLELFLPSLRLLRKSRREWKLLLAVNLGFDYEGNMENPLYNGQSANKDWGRKVELVVPVDGTVAEMAKMQRQFKEDVKGVKASEEVALVRRVIDRCVNGDYGHMECSDEEDDD